MDATKATSATGAAAVAAAAASPSRLFSLFNCIPQTRERPCEESGRERASLPFLACPPLSAGSRSSHVTSQSSFRFVGGCLGSPAVATCFPSPRDPAQRCCQGLISMRKGLSRSACGDSPKELAGSGRVRDIRATRGTFGALLATCSRSQGLDPIERA